jgi:transposase
VKDREFTASSVPQCRYCADADAVPLAGLPVPTADRAEPAWLAHLYQCRELSTYRIGEVTGLDRQRVTRVLRRAGVPLRARGAGRPRPVRRPDDPPGLASIMAELYTAERLSSRQIATVLGMPDRTVRDRLRRYGIAPRTRGGWNREDRRTVPAAILEDLYSRLGMTADEVGQQLGTSRHIVLRSAHALGIPVRSGGTVPLPGPDDVELVTALHDDQLISEVLKAHDIARVPPGGSISVRFPVPVPLTTSLVKDLYWGCGAGLNHIELLTGQPSMTVRGFMQRAGIPLRHPGGRTPFMRRWRTGQESAPPVSIASKLR